ncbi:MAG: hypothetical protein NTW96_25705 [Planctomycetia bacterium]|nr:hypothetical protein [Planctomycetia bacterium]
MKEMGDISVLHSGGSDSTLAAIYALDRAERVHLLRYSHCMMFMTDKPRKVVEDMKRVFGPDRIVEHYEPIDKLFWTCYVTGIRSRLFRYRTFYVPWVCGACKMAMHFRTLAYNKTHGIRLTYHGANRASASYFPDQTLSYEAIVKNLYAQYGMGYESPVYDIQEADVETEKYGLVVTHNTKREHLFYSTQFTCFTGVFVHAHSRLYYRLFRGKDRSERLAARMLREMIEDCRGLLPPR